MLMDLIPLDASLVKGSHGAAPSDAGYHPVIISQQRELLSSAAIDPTEVYKIIKQHVLE